MGHTYSSILRASAITASSAVAAMVIGMVATKFLSMILGPEGLGELRLFQSVLTFVGYVIGLGTGTSVVRAISSAHARVDREEVARLAWLFRRMSIVFGIAGAAAMAAMAPRISVFVFGSPDHAGPLSLLAVATFLAALQVGETAPIIGTRQLSLGARITVLCAGASALLTVGFAAWLGREGIVPGLLLTALSGFLIAAAMSRSANLGAPAVRRTSRRELLQLGQLGVSSMTVDAISQGSMVAASAAIVHEHGLAANGIYLAAWNVSGVFATFVLSAMAADYFPRLSAVQHDRDQLSRAVNSQIEVGMLMALPGLIAMLCFAPEVIRAFYSMEFEMASTLLPWFVLHAFLKVISTPIAYIFPAIGAGSLNVATQSLVLLGQLALALVGLRVGGLEGFAVGTLIAAMASIAVFTTAARVRVGFLPSSAVVRLAAAGATLLGAGMFLHAGDVPGMLRIGLGGLLALAAALLCLRGLTLRLGKDHRLVRTLWSIRPLAWAVQASLPRRSAASDG